MGRSEPSMTVCIVAQSIRMTLVNAIALTDSVIDFLEIDCYLF
jgi:hypothetical protein